MHSLLESSVLAWIITASLSTAYAEKLSFSVPLQKNVNPVLRKRDGNLTAGAGLGDYADSFYSIVVKLGGLVDIPLQFDTGSSDLWSISNACTDTSCGNSTNTPKLKDPKLTDLPVRFQYGTQAEPTVASGMIGSDKISIAGIELPDQFYAAVNTTNQSIPGLGASGIFGAGFPYGVLALIPHTVQTNFSKSGEDTPERTEDFLANLGTRGDFLSRLVVKGLLKIPMYTLTIQRNKFDIGGNVGQLNIGDFPPGVKNESLTWVPVVRYTKEQGGISSPPDRNETFAMRWEIPVDAVLINGKELPVQPGDLALIDSGATNILFVAPVLKALYTAISANGSADSLQAPIVECAKPINLAVRIGGKLFPIDPRDAPHQEQTGDGKCVATDNYGVGDVAGPGSLSSILLGDSFMKSVFIAFYYGNLTHPSVDPPRIGFLSTMPENAPAVFVSQMTGTFAATATIQTAPAGTYTATATNSVGVAQAPISAGRAGGNSTTKPNAAQPSAGIASTTILLAGIFITVAQRFL